MKKILAFTLAETLVVIGIIGIVSALTLPNLNSSTGDKEKVAKLKKIYRDLDQAYGMAKTKYGPIQTWFTNDITNAARTTRFGQRLTEFMKVSKNCGIGSGCWSTAPLLESNGSKWEDNAYQEISDHYFVTLADGTALAMDLWYYDNAFSSGRIRVDIDGPKKGQTRIGSDIFNFTIGFDGTNNLSPSAGNYEENGPFDTSSSENYAKWVIEFENLDYLKCADKLNWQTQITCK